MTSNSPTSPHYSIQSSLPTFSQLGLEQQAAGNKSDMFKNIDLVFLRIIGNYLIPAAPRWKTQSWSSAWNSPETEDSNIKEVEVQTEIDKLK